MKKIRVTGTFKIESFLSDQELMVDDATYLALQKLESDEEWEKSDEMIGEIISDSNVWEWNAEATFESDDTIKFEGN